MIKIIIKHIGPLTSVELDLNKVNIIMGPQSSGKSTIAKIVSYCQWVEKRFVLDGSFNYSFIERFMEFHRISSSYFNENSLIEYKSNSVYIKYLGRNYKPTIKIINKSERFINSKNIYIPAERNFVSTIPNLGKYKETNDNIMNFLYDWYEAKREYPKSKKLPILNLDISYYYIKKTDTDQLILKNNKNKELALQNASSGLQSVIPMLLLVDYLSSKIYASKSFDEKKEFSNFISNYFSKKLENEQNENEFVDHDEDEENISLKFDISKNEINKIAELFINRSKYHYSQFIIEEPEQNLFPKAQRDLIYNLINRINSKQYDHKLLITTHSPFILYALNNCMTGYLVKEKMPNEEKNELASSKSWINPKLVSIWEIKNDGTIKSIKNKETNTVSKHYFNEIMNEIMDEYYDMLNYLEL